VGEGGVRSNPGERALELSNVRQHVFGDELEDIGWYRSRSELRVAAQDRKPGFHVRSLDVRQQAPLEPAAQTVLQSCQMLGMSIRADDELFAGLVESVERVKELFEDLFLPIEELHIVEKQDIDGPVAGLELVHALAPDAVDELVEELLGAHVADDGSWCQLAPVMTDSVQEMGFAQAGVRVDEKRVVLAAGLFGDGHGGRIGESVGGADNEIVERVLGDEAVLPMDRRTRLLRMLCDANRTVILVPWRRGGTVADLGEFGNLEFYGDFAAVDEDGGAEEGRKVSVSDPRAVKLAGGLQDKERVMPLGPQRCDPRLPGSYRELFLHDLFE